MVRSLRSLLSFVVLVALLGACPDVSSAQESQELIRITMSHTGQDSLGRVVARELELEISGSDRFQLVDTEKEADILLLIQTLDPLGGTETARHMTVYSIVLLERSGQIIKTWLGRAGRNHVDDSAATILTTMADYVTGATGP